MYAYYLSRAAWEGSKICWFQRSYESPALFVLLNLVFSQDMEALKEKVISAGLTDLKYKQMLVYSAAVFNNCGNYKSFGDTKFVPELDPSDFKAFVRASENYAIHKDVMEEIMNKIEREVYTEDEPFARLGFRDENNGTNSYYSSNITKDDAKMIDEWCQDLKISPLNTRLFKLADKEYELRICSANVDNKETSYLKTYEKVEMVGENKVVTKMHVIAGDFSSFMAKVVDNIQSAKEFSANVH